MNKASLLAPLVLISLIAPNTASAFTDVQGHWAKGIIDQWNAYAWIGGYPDGTFRPDARITRAEFVTLLSTAAPLYEQQSFRYTDVTIDQWFATALRKAMAAKAISGYPDGTFSPTQPITRAEVAAVLGRVKQWKEQPTPTEQYTDASQIAQWSKGFVGASVALDVMRGYPDGTFRPDQPITRAEAVSVLHRSFVGNTAPIQIVAIGDSLTAGFGDETSIGYVHRLGAALRKRTNLPIYVKENYAVNGNKTTDILDMLAPTSKNTAQIATLQQAQLIVMTIGGNDLHRFGDPFDPDVIVTRIPKAQEQIKKIFTTIRDINRSAHIVYVGLYNPFDARATALIQQWNASIPTLAPDKNITVVHDVFPNDMKPYLAWDNYHLNSAGYTLMAEKAAEATEQFFRQ